MRHFIGIDLGTTNSAICSFDGSATRVWKSPEQSDVTPSAIYVDRHGHRFYGRRAYDMAPADEKNAATLFKRYLGTSMKFTLEASGEELTPEECSAEILRLLYGYLPREWQEDSETATVITVPAAFNQMKKDATLQAAQLAGIGQVALMQEPVAAVMSIMKEKPIDGIFLVYDLGGGTFDISVAEHAGGQVNLLAQGGREMCGGRDWERMLLRSVVIPWLRQNFSLPDGIERIPEYRRLRQLALYACEQAKIELSMRSEAFIRMDESVLAQKDLKGEDIYLNIPLTRPQLNDLIGELLAATVEVTRDTVQKAGVRMQDVNSIVFIGGPTMYPPLQDYVMRALSLSRKGEANPMTAVAEGAAIFAESIDWSSRVHHRLESVRKDEEKDFEIRYEQRVSADTARVAVIHREGKAFSAEITSEADGWTSGRVSFTGRGILNVPLRQVGSASFRLRLFDSENREVPLSGDRLTFSRVAASVSAIPSSHAIAIKALERVGGPAVPVYLVRENERLPKRGTVTLRAGKRLVAGSNDALVFTLWEGEIRDPIEDNRYIGIYRIPGISIPSGVVNVGDEIQCEYEVGESGTLQLGVVIPSAGAVLAEQNFYSRFEGQTDLSDPSALLRTANRLQNRVIELQSGIISGELIKVLSKLGRLRADLQSEDPETVQQAANELLECQREVARFRQSHIRDVRVIDLNRYRDVVDSYRDSLSESDVRMLDELYDAARQAIEYDGDAYESILMQYRVRSWGALQHSERFIIDQFRGRVKRPERYTDRAKFDQLSAEGRTCIENNDIGRLKTVISRLDAIEKPRADTDSEDMYEKVSVLKG